MRLVLLIYISILAMVLPTHGSEGQWPLGNIKHCYEVIDVRDLIRPKKIIIHHSATRDTDTLSFNAIRDYHMEEKKWDDIGYHFIIEVVNGIPRVLTGRGLQFTGAHCANHNDTIGICVVGNFDRRRPQDGVLSLLARTLRGLIHIFPYLRASDIDYHNKYSPKTCPGLLFPPVEEVRFFTQEGL